MFYCSTVTARIKQSQTYVVKKTEEIVLFLAGIKDQWDEDRGRILPGDNTCSGVVRRRLIRFKCFGAWISRLLLYCIYMHIV